MLDNNKNALTDDELEQVTGGDAVPSNVYEGVTRMLCDFCGESHEWAGDYMGWVGECRCCGRHEFHGQYWVHYT